MKTANYIIVGDNNFWYDTLFNVTPEQMKARIEELKAEVDTADYNDQINMLPNNLIAYEIGEPETFVI